MQRLWGRIVAAVLQESEEASGDRAEGQQGMRGGESAQLHVIRGLEQVALS